MIETAFQTNCGMIREHNEDSGGLLYNQKGDLLAVVADGMGGHRAGDVASALTLDFIKEKWTLTDESFTKEEAKTWLAETIQEANSDLLSYAAKHPECEGMGTTVVAALCAPEFIVIGHVGDSRCYMLMDQHLQQVTRDHSLVNEFVRRGEISEEEAAVHPQKHVVLQALGTEAEIIPEIQAIEESSSSIILLCSDGLSDSITDEQIKKILHADQSLQKKADAMIEAANAAGGIDNITLALLRAYHQSPPPATAYIQKNQSDEHQRDQNNPSSSLKEGASDGPDVG